MRFAARIRVPNALRGLMMAAGRQGRRVVLTATSYLGGGSTWLVSLSLLARSDFAVGSASNGPRRARPGPALVHYLVAWVQSSRHCLTDPHPPSRR